MTTKTLIFNIGEDPNGKEPKNYVKKLLAQYSCATVQKIIVEQCLSVEQQKDIHTFWTECGHRVREKVNNDIKLEYMLRNVMPKYIGDDVALYRGENKKRYDDNYIGFCWTTNIEIAQMFAEGLNSYSFGGVLLQCTFKREQIIAAPSQHSLYLGEHEYTVAPSCLNFDEILILKSYPATNINL